MKIFLLEQWIPTKSNANNANKCCFECFKFCLIWCMFVVVIAECFSDYCVICLFVVFVQHDSTVAPFLSAMQVFNNISPPYTASVLVELFNSSGHFSVKILYLNDSLHHVEPFNMTVPGKAPATYSSTVWALKSCSSRAVRFFYTVKQYPLQSFEMH